MESELVCFDPRDILNITNKWDMIDCDKCSSNEENQDNATLFWKLIKSEIKRLWPCVKEENIFRMSLKDVKVITKLNGIYVKRWQFSRSL